MQRAPIQTSSYASHRSHKSHFPPNDPTDRSKPTDRSHSPALSDNSRFLPSPPINRITPDKSALLPDKHPINCRSLTDKRRYTPDKPAVPHVPDKSYFLSLPEICENLRESVDRTIPSCSRNRVPNPIVGNHPKAPARQPNPQPLEIKHLHQPPHGRRPAISDCVGEQFMDKVLELERETVEQQRFLEKHRLVRLKLGWELKALSLDGMRMRSNDPSEQAEMKTAAAAYRQCVADLSSVMGYALA